MAMRCGPRRHAVGGESHRAGPFAAVILLLHGDVPRNRGAVVDQGARDKPRRSDEHFRRERDLHVGSTRRVDPRHQTRNRAPMAFETGSDVDRRPARRDGILQLRGRQIGILRHRADGERAPVSGIGIAAQPLDSDQMESGRDLGHDECEGTLAGRRGAGEKEFDIRRLGRLAVDQRAEIDRTYSADADGDRDLQRVSRVGPDARRQAIEIAPDAALVLRIGKPWPRRGEREVSKRRG